MKKTMRRFLSVASAAIISAGAIAMFAACTSSEPEVTICYEFNGKEYEVEYVLSRSDAPKTVQHFIELADAGYYDGTCIHDYTSTALYGGGYYMNEQNELTEKDYFAVVRELEKAGNEFTQTVWYGAAKTPLYTVYGEFTDNGVDNEAKRVNVHSKGALVMYYTDKTASAKNINVKVERNDKGDNNEGTGEQELRYATNSATSLFYTYLGTTSSALDKKYAVFGMVKDFDSLQELLDAVKDEAPDDDPETEEDESLVTKEETKTLDTLDHRATVDVFEGVADAFETVRKSGTVATFNVPREPIVIKSVKVTKY